MVAYEATFREEPTYLHARVVGEATEENAARFLLEAYQACVKSGRANLLLELQFHGAPLDVSAIFRVVAARTADGATLKKVAYVDGGTPDPIGSRFAETVAANRGVNICLFPNVTAALRWLEP